METWKDLTIPSFRTIAVSNLGQLRMTSGKLTFGADRKGYRQVTLFSIEGRKSKTFLAHRLIALAFIPNPRGLPHINHLDGVKSNNRVENLEWCDQKMNAQHAHRMGLTSNFGDGHWTRKEPGKVRRGTACNLFQHQFTGERHPGAKLREQDVQDIRKARASGAKLRTLAGQYGVCESAICAIVKRRKWAHI